MASGLAALLDDIAAIAKLAATSLDDMGVAAGQAGAKAVGVVVDDAAVTPSYAVGFTPERELPIVWKIAKGSLRNKFLFLLPGALLLSAFAAWAITPLLMAGGLYLCFEATEKILEAFAAHEQAEPLEALALSSAEQESRTVAGAIRTDLILSAEIMAIALAAVAERSLAVQAGALCLVSLLLTIGVYGFVGLIVKMDDIGVHLARQRSRSVQRLGRALVRAMPPLLRVLTVVGTAAMLWVGGGILVHGQEHFGLLPIPHLVNGLSDWARTAPGVGAVTGWLAYALGSALTGLLAGGAVVAVMRGVSGLRRGPTTPPRA
jgi:predicted DNA repair protein MutK